jgi:ribosomal small subunit protein bTHX
MYITCENKLLAMGKGDKKSKRGKIFNGTFGVRRPHRHHPAGQPSANSQVATAMLAAETPVKRAAGGAKKKS